MVSSITFQGEAGRRKGRKMARGFFPSLIKSWGRILNSSNVELMFLSKLKSRHGVKIGKTTLISPVANITQW